MRPVRLVALGMTLLAAACASGSGGGGGGGEEEASGDTDRYLITAAELAPYGGSITAHEAVRRLRRFWLTGAGGKSPRLFVNDREQGGAPSLGEYNANQVVELRFVPGNEAMTRLGPEYAGGVIYLTIR
jgi:hypothetical protein